MASAGDIRGVEGVETMLAVLSRVSSDALPNALNRIGILAVREAKENAPRSPTMAVHSTTLKKKRRTTSRKMPGGLEKSIAHEVTDGGKSVSVFVAANAPAGKYAKRIHDEKGISWHRRGAGTIAKGARADDKFIERAISDNKDKFLAIIRDELNKAVK